jgi:hypothetical protein
VFVLRWACMGGLRGATLFPQGNVSHFCLVFHVASIFMSIVGMVFRHMVFCRWFYISG